MLSLINIWNVARIETKTLFRSWFFRVFAILSVVILGFLNFGILTRSQSPWMFRGIPASIPYMNLILLNVVQAVIAIFLASDFLKRDKKLDTTEVIYMRSMTNGDYVMGKATGIIFVFLVLNIAVLVLAAIFNVFFTDVPLRLSAYWVYPVLIGLPTLVFILGLSFLMMVVIGNQAVTFIVLLGYIAITLFFIGPKYHALFDYMAFNVPFMFSDFVGFGNGMALLFQRGIYFVLGLSFIFATIYLIKRLPQSRIMTKTSMVFSIILFLAGIFLALQEVSQITESKSIRKQMVEINKDLVQTPQITPTEYYLSLKQLGNTIEGTANISFTNKTAQPIQTYFFNINPGLKVKTAEQNGSELPFSQQLHLIKISPPSPLFPGSASSVIISYSGTINDKATYLDVPEEDRDKAYRAFIYNIDKRHGFVTPEYLLLTPEDRWYPTPGILFNPDHPESVRRNFIRFHLQVETLPGLLAISQGKVENSGDGKILFEPETPLEGLSLAAGSYQKRTVTIDSIDYNLFTLKEHNYFEPYLNELGDTLKVIIRETKQDYEAKLNTRYLFKRLNLVEAPVQFISYPRLHTISQETVQPEIIFLPENGVFLRSADFKMMKYFEKRRQERSNEVFTDKEIQSRLFRRFVSSTFTGSGFRGFRFGGPPMPESYTSIFPQYFTYVNHFESKKWPVFNLALESFFDSKINVSTSPYAQMFTGMTDEDLTNQALLKESLQEIIKDPEESDIVHSVLKAKGAYLFSVIQSRVGEEEFQKFITEILKNDHFRDVSVENFISELKEKYNLDFKSFIENWYASKQLPAFIVADIQAYKVIDKDRTRSQVLFKVSNTEPVAGLLKVAFRGGGGRGGFSRGGPPGDEVVRYIPVQANQTKQVGIVLDFEPRGVNISTLISKNLPASIFKRFENLEENQKATPFDGEKVLEKPIQLAMPGETIVDDEDPGFKDLYQPKKGALSGIFERFRKKDDDKYIGIRWWNPPKRWRAGTYSEFYGKYIHSAHFIKSGKGEKKVAWNAELKQSGYYDIYYYVSRVRQPFRRRGRNRNEGSQGDYHFIVHHDDGNDEITLDVNKADDGWNFLGSYYISQGTATVELSNKSKSRMVFADAVKWVKRK